MSEKLTIEKDLFANSLEHVLEGAQVPMRHHLSILKVMEMNLAKAKKDREMHKQMMLEHARQLQKAEQLFASHKEEMARQAQTHETQIASYEAELARYQTLIKGEEGYTPVKGVDYFDAETPSMEEIVEAVKPHLPAPIQGETGKDATFDTEAFKQELIAHFKKEKPFDMADIKGAQDFVLRTSQKNIKVKFEELMHGASSSTSGSNGYQKPTSGAVNGSNTTYTWATAPNVIVVDQGRPMQKVSSDGTVNWTGTTTSVLSVAPNFDIFSTN